MYTDGWYHDCIAAVYNFGVEPQTLHYLYFDSDVNSLFQPAGTLPGVFLLQSKLVQTLQLCFDSRYSQLSLHLGLASFVPMASCKEVTPFGPIATTTADMASLCLLGSSKDSNTLS